LSKDSEITKNNKAWEKLFDKYKIIDNIEQKGYFEITASQINEFREARLMTKFDHRANLPKLFIDNNLSILPITRGSYIISNFEAYKDFEQLHDKITIVSFPEYIESIDYENITSEAIAINCVYISNILADFLGDDKLVPTVSGRMSSGKFSFNIWNKANKANITINVANSQVEIDGGFEGVNQLALIEAKNFIADDFLIRQLYYPYRLWSNKVSKKIIPIFLIYSNGIFSLYEYEFQDIDNYNSLCLVKQKNYSIEAVGISLNDISAVLNRVKIIQEPKIAFPQADKFERVINLCELLLDNEMTRDDITLNYAFTPRQTNYYTDAGRYLGLIDKRKKDNEIVFSLTEEGRKILRSKYKERQLKFVEVILRHKVFNEVLKFYLRYGKTPSKSKIVDIMKTSNLYNVEAENTYYRRASTVISWINWILDLPKGKA